MSWKGFQKGIVRTPQNILHKIHHAPKDQLYMDAQQRFDEIEMQIKRLHTECKRYWEAIGRLLHHQIEFSKIVEQLYLPITGRYILAEGQEQEDPSSAPEGAAAAAQYRDLLIELQELVKPELEMIETRILKPADDLLVIINSVKKILVKREHKRLDLERQEQGLRKLQDRDERSVKQEEKMYKVENDYEMAMEEYNYYTELLKAELPKLFRMEGDFIKPLFQSLYFMQLNIYYTMHIHMEEMKIAHFHLEGEVVEAFHRTRGDVETRLDNIGIAHFRETNPQSKLETLRRKHSKNEGDYDSMRTSPGSPMSPSSPASPQPLQSRMVPPQWDESMARSPSTRSASAEGRPRRRYQEDIDADGPPRPPRPARKPAAAPNPPPIEMCTALYDFDALNAGDLNFRAGDRIEIIKRTEKAEGWWTGRLNGQQGTFPGNYVELI